MMDRYLLLFLLVAITHVSALPTIRPNDCANVPPMCYKLISNKYTKMRLPNMLNHTRYEDVEADIKVWRPLLNSSTCNAGNQLKYFLCFTYAPVCVDKLISPCKSLCETVRDSCDPVMRQYNYSWPAFFNCNQANKFHDDSSSMCINLKMLGKDDCSCKGGYTRKTLKALICQSDFVVSAWVTKQRKKENQIDVKLDVKKSGSKSGIFYQNSSVKNFITSKLLRLHLFTSKRHCRCNKLRVKKKAQGSGRYVIIGKKIGGKMRVSAMKLMKRADVSSIKKMVKKCRLI